MLSLERENFFCMHQLLNWNLCSECKVLVTCGRRCDREGGACQHEGQQCSNVSEYVIFIVSKQR